MIRPSSQSESCAKADELKPFSQRLRLTNLDAYIKGPFDFAEGNCRKTRDRVPKDRWITLAKFGHMFNNEEPSIFLTGYAVHFGQYHTVYSVPDNNACVATC